MTSTRSLMPRSSAAHRSPSSAATAPLLRAHFAGDPVAIPTGDTLRAILCETLDRGPVVPAAHAPMWEQFLGLLESNRADPRATARCAVLANLVALVAFDDPSDIAATAELASQLGETRLARLQHRASRALEVHDRLPWTTTAVRRLLDPALPVRLVDMAGSTEEADRIARACAVAAQSLIFEDLDPDRVATPIGSVRDFLELAERGTIADWRDQLGMIAASPWSLYAEQLVVFATESQEPYAVAAVESSIELCRDWCRDRERDDVAREIRQLVALSGASQREFAARVGTSPSRLSTYVRGTVTPSAAMLLRIQRASRMLQRQSNRVVDVSRR